MKSIAEFIIEAGLLKRTRRSGWSVVGISNAESVADHSFRCALIGYFLARSERIPAEKVVMMALLNDIHETRITDLHKMAQRYIDGEKAEDRAFAEQAKTLPASLRKEFMALRAEYRSQKTGASIIARDADILECLIQAREYETTGYKSAVIFTKRAPNFLKTKSARRLWRYIRKGNVNAWWSALSDFRR
jgi:putative hydrolase of HD superfamily